MYAPEENESVVYIKPLLKRLWPAQEDVTAGEIASAVSHIFTNSLTPVQTGALLTALHFTGLDSQADVLSKCAEAMRDAAAQVDKKAIRDIIR
jgi:anthranilate phosphoribosyltransferase